MEGAIRVVTDSRGTAEARFLVNAAGLHSDEIANLLGNAYRLQACRGDYFTVTGPKRHLVTRSIYPVPEETGLGIHLTRLCDDTLLIGPDARYVGDKNDYADLPVFDEQGDIRTDADPFLMFYEAARDLVPAFEPKDFTLAHAGIRASRKGPDESSFRDFVIERDARYPHVIHLVGIDSPGLTSAPAIGEYVAGLVSEMV